MANIPGTSGDDNINGTATDDVIIAGTGNDTIDAGAGNDAVIGDVDASSNGSGGTVVLSDQLDSEQRIDGTLYGRFPGTFYDGTFNFSSDAFYLGDDIGVLDGANRNELRGQVFTQDGSGNTRVAELVDIDYTGAQKSYVGLATVQRTALHGANDQFSASNGDGFQDVVVVNDVDVTFTMNDGTVFQHIRMQFLRGDDGKTYLLADDHPQEGTFNSIRTTVFRNDSGIESMTIESSSGNINGINPIVGNWAAGQFFDTVDPAGAGDDLINGGTGSDLIFGDNADGPDGSPTTLDVTDLSGGQIVSGDGSVTAVVSLNGFTANNTFGRPAPEDVFYSGPELGGGTKTLDLAFDAPVSDVSFTILDVNQGHGWDDQVRIIALDADGNQLPVTFSGGNVSNGGVDVRGNTIDANDNNTTLRLDDNNPDNVQVQIDGPISTLQVIHEPGNDSSSVTGWIGVSDIDVSPVVDPINGTFANGDGGDDTIVGGQGADIMFGEGGDDTFIVDNASNGGSDVVGNASDGAGDVIVGGNGPDQNTDNDTLDLRGSGPVTVNAVADSNDAGAQSGTVTFADGSTLRFVGIETILQDQPTLTIAPKAGEPTDANGNPETAENGAPVTIVVSRDGPTDQPLLVTLASDDPSEATVPATVVIPAGASSVEVPVTPADDTLVDGTTMPVITATAPGTNPGSTPVAVADDDQPTLTIAPKAGEPTDANGNPETAENGAPVTIVVSRDGPTDQPLLVTLASDDPSEATVPATVVIPAGASSVEVPVTPADDTLVDGTTMPVITATAPGTNPGSTPVAVADDDQPTLTIAPKAGEPTDANGNPETAENGAPVTIVVSRDGPTDQPLLVTLASDDPSEATVPATVVIPAGASSVEVPVTPADDTLVDGTTMPVITATAPGTNPGSTPVAVADDDQPTLTIAPKAGEPTDANGNPETAENGAPVTIVVSRDGPTDQPLLVTLASDDPSEATVPATVVIPAGASSVEVPVTPADDTLVDGTTMPVITATAPGTNPGSTPVAVLDDDTAPNGTVDGEDTGENMGLGYDDSNAPTDGGGDQITNGDDVIEGNGGDDTIDGADGDDVIDGGDEDDVLTGGAGADTIDGGDDDDVIIIDNAPDAVGDVVDGGDGGTDNDTLDLTGAGPVVYRNVTPDSDGNGEDGVVDILDPVTGAVVATVPFTNIENFLDDGPFEPTLTIAPAPGQPTDGSGNPETAENGTPAQIVILRNGPTDQPLTVTLSSDDTSEATVQPTVVIPAGSSFAIVPVTPVDDELVDGPQTANITATAPGATPATAPVTVLDDDTNPTGPDGIVNGEEFGENMGVGYDDANAPTDNGGDLITNGDDSIQGNGGDDTINAGAGDDTIEGGDGVDRIGGQNGDDLIDGNDGNDKLLGQNGMDTINGGDGNDYILGGADADVLNGEADADVIRINVAADADGDVVDGGSAGNDNDKLDLRGAGLIRFASQTTDSNGNGTDGVIEFVDALGNTISTLTYSEIENIVSDGIYSPTTGPDGTVDGEQTGEDMGVGYDDSNAPNDNGGDVITNGPDVIEGNGGDDTINAGGGDDTIDGGDEDDLLNGGAGEDEINGGNDSDTITASSAPEAFGDTVDGGAGGHDFDVLDLRGLGPVDIINETPDSNGNGTDGTIVFQNANDGTTVGFMTFAEIEQILTDGPFIPSTGSNGIVDGTVSGDDMTVGYTDAEGDMITNGDDVIYSYGGRDEISSGSGNDTIFSGSGADVVRAGAGDDVINTGSSDGGYDKVVLGSGADVLIFEEGGGQDRVSSFGHDDKIDLSSYDFDDFSEVQALFTPLGGRHTNIDLGGGDEIIIYSSLPGELDSDNFIL